MTYSSNLRATATLPGGQSYLTVATTTLANTDVLANDTDPQGFSLTAVNATNPTHGTLIFSSNGSFVYTPNLGYLGPDRFTYQANDGSNNSNVATVNISVTAVLSIPTNLTATPGGSVVVPVNLNDPDPAGSGGLIAATIAIDYNPTIFSVSSRSIALGTLTSGWNLTANVGTGANSGEIGIVMLSNAGITSTIGGSICLITFSVNPNAPHGPSPINIAATNTPGGSSTVATSLYASGVQIPLRPVPTNAANDPGVDSIVTVPAPQWALTTPLTATTGTSFGFIVAALNPNGTVNVGYTGTVHFASSDLGAQLPGDYPFTASDAGVHVFSDNLQTVGTQNLSATDSNSGATTFSEPILVNAQEANFSINVPATVPVTVSFDFTVTSLDGSNSRTPGYSGVVHFTSSDAAAVLPADATLSGGVGVFGQS